MGHYISDYINATSLTRKQITFYFHHLYYFHWLLRYLCLYQHHLSLHILLHIILTSSLPYCSHNSSNFSISAAKEWFIFRVIDQQFLLLRYLQTIVNTLLSLIHQLYCCTHANQSIFQSLSFYPYPLKWLSHIRALCFTALPSAFQLIQSFPLLHSCPSTGIWFYATIWSVVLLPLDSSNLGTFLWSNDDALILLG